MISPKWLAGLFDGEGSCSVLIYPHRRSRGLFCPVITITQSEHKGTDVLKILQEIKEQYGFKGGVSVAKQGKYKERYTLRLTSREDIKKFIELVGEHSKFKHKHLMLMKEFLQIKDGEYYWTGPEALRAMKIAHQLAILNEHISKKKIIYIEQQIAKLQEELREHLEKVGAGVYPKGCKFCGSPKLRKDGLTPQGKQRFECKTCKRKFVWTVFPRNTMTSGISGFTLS